MAATFLGSVDPPDVVAAFLSWLPRMTAVMTAARTSDDHHGGHHDAVRAAWLPPLPLLPPLRIPPLGAAAWILALRLALLLVMRGASRGAVRACCSGSLLVRSSWSVVLLGNRNRSRLSAVRGRTTSHAAQASSPTSRAISCGYCVWEAAMVPPWPKHPQSMDRPRAHAEAIPAMKTTMSKPPTTALNRVNRPRTSSTPTATSRIGRP